MATDKAQASSHSQVEVRDGRPVICLNGVPAPQAAYCDYITSSPTYEARIREFAENGTPPTVGMALRRAASTSRSHGTSAPASVTAASPHAWRRAASSA